MRADGLVVIENDDGDWSVVGLSLDEHQLVVDTLDVDGQVTFEKTASR